ncbi:MAG: YidC/Oxa1 family membrane protein insertase, partial [Wenzhouxiangellaceae bacterium]
LNSRYFALLLNPVAGTDLGDVSFRLDESREPESLPSQYLPVVTVELEVAELAAGQSARWQFEVFSGPKSRAALTGTADASDYSGLLFHGLWRWMRGLSLGLLRVLEWLYGLVPSWGLAICLLAVLVRLILYPVARWALSSQQKFSDVQRRIQPEMARIKKKYKGGEQSERILQLYEKHGVSPLAGLKPLLIVLIQIPVFVALFHVLGQAFELRQASFLWMDSLAEPDRLFGFGFDLPFFGAYFNLLPVLMAISTLITIKLSPAPASSDAERRRQNIFMILMALAFFLLFYPFPSGMVLYWTIANVLHIVQARITPRPPAP